MTASWPRWLLVGLIALEAILLATGRISLGAAIALIGAVEVAVTLILMVVGWRATRGFEGPFLDRLEIGIAAVAGGVVSRPADGHRVSDAGFVDAGLAWRHATSSQVDRHPLRAWAVGCTCTVRVRCAG